ncbi:MAG: type II secretion system protein GspG, partial [Planctomycetota bacterium]
QCKDELQQLAAAVRTFRLQERPGQTVTPAQLAAAQNDGKAIYSGPVSDPWGHSYVLRKRATGVRWEALSLGQDGLPDTDDDMVAQEPRGS